MMRSVFLRTLYDKRWFMLGWSCAIAALAVLMIAMFPSLKDSMSNLAASMPEGLRGLVGDIDSFTQLDSFISSQLYDIRIPLFLMIMATVLGLGIGPSFEDRGALRTVLSTSVSRGSWFMQTWMSALVIFSVTLAVSALVSYVTIRAIGETPDIILLTKLAAISLSFAMCVFTIVFGLGMATGSRSLALGVGVGIITLSIILEAGRAVDWLDPFQYVSLLHYYDASKLVKDGIDLIHQLIIGSLMIISFIVGFLRLRRRDLN